jgi:hypothetical protein
MPVIGDTKVVPQSIEDSYNSLRQAYEEKINGKKEKN